VPRGWPSLGADHPQAAHLAAVERLAVSLARRHGLDPARAALAARLHDWLKPLPPARLEAMLRARRVPSASTARLDPPIRHGPAAAQAARRLLGVSDRGVLEAVRWHTTGRAGGGPLLRLLWVADFAAADRRHPEAARARRLARRSLAAAARYVVACKLAWLAETGRAAHPATRGWWASLAGREGVRA
jgi:predicted HD superfamily hydrolase involved in NAD metabolism